MTAPARSPRADLLGFLGLAHRAGAVVMGVQPVRQALRDGRAGVVLLASDAAEGQRKKLEGLLRHRGVPSRVCFTRIELGRALGGPPLSAVALTEAGFARRFIEEPAAPRGPGAGAQRDEDDGTYAG